MQLKVMQSNVTVYLSPTTALQLERNPRYDGMRVFWKSTKIRNIYQRTIDQKSNWVGWLLLLATEQGTENNRKVHDMTWHDMTSCTLPPYEATQPMHCPRLKNKITFRRRRWDSIERCQIKELLLFLPSFEFYDGVHLSSTAVLLVS